MNRCLELLQCFWALLVYIWVSPTTLFGLLFIPFALTKNSSIRVVRGVLELQGPGVEKMLRFISPFVGQAAAMTLGHVIVGCNQQCLDDCRDHEHVHVRQCERWGPFFIPAYLLAGLIQKWRGFDPYLDNPFEKEAYEKSG